MAAVVTTAGDKEEVADTKVCLVLSTLVEQYSVSASVGRRSGALVTTLVYSRPPRRSPQETLRQI